LSSILREMIGNRNEMVVVRADPAVILNKAVRMMDVARAVGAATLCLAISETPCASVQRVRFIKTDHRVWLT
jgi:biopolymer transport protein ExbD